jgi:hypothetical protein
MNGKKKAIFLGRLYKNAGEWGKSQFFILLEKRTQNI